MGGIPNFNAAHCALLRLFSGGANVASKRSQMEVKAMLAPAEMEALKRRLNQVICPVCTESKPGGSCGLKEPDQCPMWVQLPRLIEVTRAVQSTRMDPYIRKVREDVCPNCRALPDGHCEARDEGHCALDAYLLVIVQTIEDFLAERVALASLSGSVH